MELKKIKIKSKCDIVECNKLATYTLNLKKFWNIGNANFRKDCLKQLYSEISKELTPKSPKNILKKPRAKKED